MEAGGTGLNAVHVVDMGVATALGHGADVLWEALLAGRTGLAPVRRFATDGYLSNLAGCIPTLDTQRPGSRLDALVRILFGESSAIPVDAMLITASTKAGIDQLEVSVRNQPPTRSGATGQPLDRILGCQVAESVADRLGLRGARYNISAACASATIALAVGAARIEQGEADSILVCGLDLVSEFVFSGFSALHALSSSACRPFDTGRDGLLLGEGAAYLLLMSEGRCRQVRRASLGRIAGWGIASDAHHITAPSRTGEGLILAIRQALDHAGLRPADVAAVSAHGTGSVYNDAMELTAFGTLFDPLPPLHSIKGAIGHTMGACGAIEAIVGLCSLEHQCLPPTVGLRTPEPAGLGRVSPEAQPISGDYILTTNSGFGGINACLVLQRGRP
jgi:3-oxoacyl-[acyl-carrier-protein] synthase II